MTIRLLFIALSVSAVFTDDASAGCFLRLRCRQSNHACNSTKCTATCQSINANVSCGCDASCGAGEREVTYTVCAPVFVTAPVEALDLSNVPGQSRTTVNMLVAFAEGAAMVQGLKVERVCMEGKEVAVYGHNGNATVTIKGWPVNNILQLSVTLTPDDANSDQVQLKNDGTAVGSSIRQYIAKKLGLS